MWRYFYSNSISLFSWMTLFIILFPSCHPSMCQQQDEKTGVHNYTEANRYFHFFITRALPISPATPPAPSPVHTLLLCFLRSLLHHRLQKLRFPLSAWHPPNKVICTSLAGWNYYSPGSGLPASWVHPPKWAHTSKCPAAPDGPLMPS